MRQKLFSPLEHIPVTYGTKSGTIKHNNSVIYFHSVQFSWITLISQNKQVSCHLHTAPSAPSAHNVDEPGWVPLYRIAGNFCWCTFLYNLKFSVRIKFRSSNFRIFQVLQATPSGTHVGLIRTFWLIVHAPFTIKAMIRGYYIYRHIWSAVINEKLSCKKESNNLVITGKNFCRS